INKNNIMLVVPKSLLVLVVYVTISDAEITEIDDESCETLQSEIRITKDEYDELAHLRRTCSGDVSVTKCEGFCNSQVSGSKMWQMERSCMCCQESGEREASVSLFCPRAKPGEKKFRKMVTKAPLDCMCRPCTSVEEYAIIPQEIAGFADEGPFTTSAHFRRASGLQ
ncbi:Bursicon, partial [Acromyrmex echinatior]